jgi:hypothetical protein
MFPTIGVLLSFWSNTGYCAMGWRVADTYKCYQRDMFRALSKSVLAHLFSSPRITKSGSEGGLDASSKPMSVNLLANNIGIPLDLSLAHQMSARTGTGVAILVPELLD